MKQEDRLVRVIWLAFFLKFIKVVVPVPHSAWVFLKKVGSENHHGIFYPCVTLLFPKTILPSEGGDATSCANPSSSEDNNLFFSDQLLTSLKTGNTSWLVFIAFLTLELLAC